MGKSQRLKGRRLEYLLRDYLRERGYEAERVPLSGASRGFKGDVTARKEGNSYLFEMKGRQSAFKSIYSLYYATRMPLENVVRFTFGVNGPDVAMGTDFEEVKKSTGQEHFPHLLLGNPDSKFRIRTYNRILKLRKLLGQAECLVIKDDHKPLLFIKYWN